MNELNPNKYKWFCIPGYHGYEINLDTMEVRSNKHYSVDSHHIMKVRNGKVTITNDACKSVRISPTDLYIITFNSGNKLIYRADNWASMNNMTSLSYNKCPIQMDYSKYQTPAPKAEHQLMIKPFTIGK